MVHEKTEHGWTKDGPCFMCLWQDGRKTERDGGQDALSLNENQELCTGCGGVLFPEDAPYLEILGDRGHRDEEDVERSEAVKGESRGQWKKDKRDGSCKNIKEAEDRRELGVEEATGGAEERRERGKKERCAGAKDREEVVCVEKQGSLITLAWSKSAEGVSTNKEIIRALQEVETAAETLADLLTNTQQAESAVKGNITSPATPEPGPENLHASRIYPNEVKEVKAVCEEQKSKVVCRGEVCEEQKSELVCGGEVCEEQKSELVCQGEVYEEEKSELVCQNEVCENGKSELACQGKVCEEQESELCGGEVCEEQKSEQACEGEKYEEKKSELACWGEVCEKQKSEQACEGEKYEEKESELACGSEVCEEQQLQREATMRSLVHIQKRAELRWQQDRDRQLYRVQERLLIIQNRKTDEDLLGLTQEDTFRHLTSTLQQEDEQQQKTLMKEKLQQLRRERSYILQSRRERNTAGFKELLAPSTRHMTNTEDGL
ncbi:cilia- and flagella-associated protein 251 [Electrophorus electricus]|uniref:cilia- and flagella-associated protein 251 n=1 Tax=Electrophorus electricus TaxID=8005 RepID=UPI0015D0300F|nr:cilia- and flagella-associated protein 251 [Electrophorus electricus]